MSYYYTSEIIAATIARDAVERASCEAELKAHTVLQLTPEDELLVHQFDNGTTTVTGKKHAVVFHYHNREQLGETMQRYWLDHVIYEPIGMNEYQTRRLEAEEYHKLLDKLLAQKGNEISRRWFS